MRWTLILLTFFNGLALGRLLTYAFDVPDQYLRQGYHQCDHPSGWCENEKEADPCGK